ncbi:hypothetical protein C8J57DRAFT_1477080 [Mycena rebaudengoi]|nr:hypothetical protein C8J57DRAFT_1477080 [Mycena rebaudengoi]
MAVTAEDIVAVAFLVDSSLLMASEWPKITTEYVMPLLRRLSEVHPNVKFRMAVVTYGTQGSPILCKNFFMDAQPVMAAMREDTGKLGIGQTTCGGGRGMAALEGYVAAVELFDILIQTVQPKTPSFQQVYHLFHICAAPPDESEHPQFNMTPALDDVTWDSLPAELKKRNINLSSMSLLPKLPKFAELHAACSTSTIAPWFPVRPHHVMLLSGFSAVPQKGIKRPGDPIPVDRTPEAKRAKTTSETSPKAAITNTPPNPCPDPDPTQNPTPTPAQPQPQTQAQTQSPGPTRAALPAQFQFPPARIQQIQLALRAAEQPVRALETAITEARTKGDTALAETLLKQWTLKNAAYQKLRANVAMVMQGQRAAYMQALQQQQATAAAAAAQQQQPQQQQAGAQGAQGGLQQGQGGPQQGGQQGGQGQGQLQGGLQQQTMPAVQAAQQHLLAQQQQQQQQQGQMAQDDGDVQMAGMGDAGGGDNNNIQQPQQQQQQPQQQQQQQQATTRQHRRPGTRPHALAQLWGRMSTSMVNMNPGMANSPMIAQQMAKLMEQKLRSQQGSPNLGQQQQQQQNQQQNQQQQNQNLDTGTAAAAATAGPASRGSGGGLTQRLPAAPVWQGRFTWEGVNPAGTPRSLTAYIIGSAQNMANPHLCRAETWPTEIILVLTRQTAVTIPELQHWMKRYQPLLVTFQANPTAPNAIHNETAYKALVVMLTTKNLYYTASWVLPGGTHPTPNALIFPVHNVGLVGAFYPTGGITEMPQDYLAKNPGPAPVASVVPTASSSAAAATAASAAPPPNIPPQGSNTTPQQRMLAIHSFMQSQGVNLPQPFLVQLAKMDEKERTGTLQMLIRNGQEQLKRRAAQLAQQKAAKEAEGGMGGAGDGQGAAMGQGGMGGMGGMGMEQQQVQVQGQQAQIGMGMGNNMGNMGMGMSGGMGQQGQGQGMGMMPQVGTTAMAMRIMAQNLQQPQQGNIGGGGGFNAGQFGMGGMGGGGG